MISCHQHDYIEIACLYNLHVELKLNDGSVKVGVAQTTQYNPDKQECLVIDIDDSLINVDLKSLLKMQALDENPHFDTVIFNQQ